MSDSLGLGVFSLQSGFVLAVLIGGLFLAERLGGDEGFARKATLAAIAVALTLVVISGTTAFLRPPDLPEGVNIFSGSSSESEETRQAVRDYSEASARRASDAGSIHLGVGILLALTGGLLFRRSRAALGILLGGVLLVFLGATPSGSESLFSSLFAIYGNALAGSAGQVRDVIRFVVLLVGSLALLGFAYWRWDRSPTEMQRNEIIG